MVVRKLRELSLIEESIDIFALEYKPGITNFNSVFQENTSPRTSLFINTSFENINDLKNDLSESHKKNKLFRIVFMIFGSFNAESIVSLFESVAPSAEIEYFDKNFLTLEQNNILTLLSIRIK
ncbi:hypothetical protein MASR1M107_13210 [Ignavibacteriales bacterium]